MFIPHTDRDRNQMLQAIGLNNLEDLFEAVPEEYRFPGINIPPALTEMEALEEAQELAAVNDSTQSLACFLGAGAYHHYIPAAVDAILRRGEFYTAYTPYQPEISQGTLQAIYEYQSLITALTGMEVSNASHYDGATAAAEAVRLAYANFRGKRSRVILSPPRPLRCDERPPVMGAPSPPEDDRRTNSLRRPWDAHTTADHPRR